MSLPTNVGTGRVTAQFLVGLVDGSDPDQMPEAIPAQGRVVFTASVPYLPDPLADPRPVTILNTEVVAVLDNEGILCTPVEGTLEPLYSGVRLIATDDSDLTVTGWTWLATYYFEPVNGKALSIPTHSFAVPKFGEVDLTTVVKVPSSTGIGTEQAEALAASAQAAAVASAADAAAAQAAASAAAAEASANDAGVTTLITTGGTTTRTAVTDLVTSSNATKLNTDDAVNTYQSQSALDAAVAAKVNTGGTGARTAVQTIADAAAAPKLDSATAATTYAAKSVETTKLDASQKGAASGVATLDSALKVPVPQIPAGLPVDQLDYVQALAARAKTTKMQIKKINSTNEVEVSCLSASGNHVTYQFYGSTAGDDYRVLANIWAGTSTLTTVQASKKLWADVTTTGAYTAVAAAFVYTTDKVTPATFTTSITVDADGSDLRFHTYRDNRGGVWELTVGGMELDVLTSASTYAATAAYNTAGIVLLKNLRPGTYTVSGKFVGDDPLNAPSTGAGTARGWLANNADSTSSSATLVSVYSPFRAINKDILLKPASNMDIAMEVKPAGGATYEWVPYHGIATSFLADQPVYLDGDTVIDVAAMASGQYRVLTSFELVQRFYGRNTSSGATNLIEVATSHVVRANGQVTVNGKWKALADIVLGNNYVMMFPASMPIFDQLASSIGNAYVNNAGLIGTETNLVPENDTAMSYLFLSSTNKSVAAAARYNNVQETIRRGKGSKNPDATKAFLQHRDANIVKVYNRPYAPGTAIPTGTVHRFGGDYLYAQGTGLYDQFAL